MTEYYLSSFVSFEEENHYPIPQVTVSIGDLTPEEFEVFVTEIKKIPFVFSFWIEDEPQEIGDQWKQHNGSLYEIMIRKRKDHYTVREKLSLQRELENTGSYNERDAFQIFVKTAETIRNLRDKYSVSSTQTWGEKLKKYDDEHPATPEELKRYEEQLENLKAIGQHALQHAMRSSTAPSYSVALPDTEGIGGETKSDVLPRKKKSRWTHEQRKERKNIKTTHVSAASGKDELIPTLYSKEPILPDAPVYNIPANIEPSTDAKYIAEIISGHIENLTTYKQPSPPFDESKGTWVPVGKAAEILGYTIGTLENYRMSGTKTDDGNSGIDKAGNRWKNPTGRKSLYWIPNDTITNRDNPE